MPKEQSTPKAETATPPPDPDNKSRDHGDLLDEDGFLPLPGNVCIIDYEKPIPWHRRLLERITGWFA